MTNLTKSQISILADYYSNRYNAWGTYSDLYDAIKNMAMKESILYTSLYLRKWVKYGKVPIKLFIAKLIKTIMNFYFTI